MHDRVGLSLATAPWRQVRAAQARGRPYTIVFVGVNGVGKSTNLAKVAYWLLQNDVKVGRLCCKQSAMSTSFLSLRARSRAMVFDGESWGFRK